MNKYRILEINNSILILMINQLNLYQNLLELVILLK
jgi:hypothetical protein